MVESVGYLALGILLFYGWSLFKTFEGPAAAVGPLPADHPMHRVVEAAVFLAVAIVPMVVYFFLLLRARGRRRRGNARKKHSENPPRHGARTVGSSSGFMCEMCQTAFAESDPCAGARRAS